MVVSVQFHGVHRAVTRINEVEIFLRSDARVSDLVRHIKRTYPDLHLSQDDVAVSINDRVSTVNHPLHSDDTVAFLPHIGGG
jgi:molybdopterin converting factor small subunit